MPTLTLQQLNRATLARQLLLERSQLAVAPAVAQVAGLQAQVQNPPYIGLWTRLVDLRREAVTEAMERREIVRATMMRSTIHLATGDDYLVFWPALRPALVKALRAFFGDRARRLDIPSIVAAAEPFFAQGPRTFVELRALFLELAPDEDAQAMAYVVRTHLPLVQMPPGGTWGTGGELRYADATQYLGRPPVEDDALPTLIRRYLAAWGPATVMDVQAWSGLTKLKEALEALRPELQVHKDEKGRELFDVPDAPLPDADVAAPPRFLPEYDNLVLSHADRSRIIADVHRKGVFLSAARVRATFLVDGMVAGAWKVERAKKAATLVIEPFIALDAATRSGLSDEGERLLRWAEEGPSYNIRFADVA